MKKVSQQGFAIVELVVLVALIAAIGVIGYFVWHGHNIKVNSPLSNTTASSEASNQSKSASTPAAPQITNASGLNSAMTALNQTSVSSNSLNSNQLTSDSSGF